MTLETIYYIGQTIAVGAILASLVAIYIQQRKDHALAKAESQRQLLQLNSGAFDSLADHPTCLESVQACLVDFDSRSARQQVEFYKYLHPQIENAEIAVYLRQDNLINDSSCEKFIAWTAVLLSTPGGQQCWEQGKLVYGPEIVDALNTYMREHTSELEVVYKTVSFLHLQAGPAAETDSADEEPGE